MGRRWLPLLAMSGGLLAWSNLVVPSLPPGKGMHAVVNVGATAALLVGARAAGLTLRELGVSRSTWRAGARWGCAALAVGAAGYLVVLAVPAGRAALAGSAAVGTTAGELALDAFVLVPLGTVLCEEIAFRGVLLALALRQLPPRPAGVITALVFGLWHISGALNDARPEAGPLLVGASVAGTVALTALGGGVLAWLRLRSGSLLAPIGLHLGTNSLGVLAAAAAQ